MPGGTVNDPHVYIAIDPSGLVTINTNRSEMGTGVRTSLPMVVADEMEADWSRVRVAWAPGDEKEYGKPGHRWLAQCPPLRPADARHDRLCGLHQGAIDMLLDDKAIHMRPARCDVDTQP